MRYRSARRHHEQRIKARVRGYHGGYGPDREHLMQPSQSRPHAAYHDLVIVASDPTTKVWLADDEGHLVQMEVGDLHTRVLEGDYVVEFGLGTATYPIHLRGPSRLTQKELEGGPTCPRPIPFRAESTRN
jgi:hypothetical protein